MRLLLPASLLLLAASTLAAPRVLPPGELPRDARLAPLKDLDGYFPFTPSPSPEAWAPRAEAVRMQLRVSLGIWPEPTRTPLNAVIHGRIERDDYMVEKVFFEAVPGFFVTGNLYRPKNAAGRLPAVLCPHGHWPDGRFMRASDAEVKKQLATGGEKFESAARSPLQARCVQLARMGCVVFHYDMIGYADSTQLSFELAHKFAKQRPEMNGAESWGFYSPQAESHLQSIMGLQTWSSIRALDFLESLPDVDPQRLAVTGASGGGTQTMILAALDSRVRTAFPAVMVSTAMQGGCTCENASLLRVGTGNVEFAALFAPKPMAMSTADDWTKEMRTKGFPELQRHWAMLGAPHHVALHDRTEFPHNFNLPSREAMSAWFNQHLALGLPPERLAERDFPLLSREEMTVWNAAHPAPAARGPEFEKKLLRWWHDDTRTQLFGHATNGLGDVNHLLSIARPAAAAIFGRTGRSAGEVEYELKEKRDAGRHLVMAGLIRNVTHGEELPAIFLHPRQWNGRTVLWLDPAGKAGLFAPGDGDVLTATSRALLDAGVSVIGVDLFEQGEFRPDSQPLTATRRVKNPREAAAYTFGYNPALFARRVHDVLTVAQLVRSDEKHRASAFAVAGLGPMRPLVIAARAVSGGLITHAAAVFDRDFRFADVADLHDPMFLPGGAKYGDLPGLALLGEGAWLDRYSETAPGEKELAELVRWLAGQDR